MSQVSRQINLNYQTSLLISNQSTLGHKQHYTYLLFLVWSILKKNNHYPSRSFFFFCFDTDILNDQNLIFFVLIQIFLMTKIWYLLLFFFSQDREKGKIPDPFFLCVFFELKEKKQEFLDVNLPTPEKMPCQPGLECTDYNLCRGARPSFKKGMSWV